MRIKGKLILISLMLTVSTALLVGVMLGGKAYEDSHAALGKQIDKQMEMLVKVKKEEIENYFKMVSDQIVKLASSTNTAVALRKFVRGYKKYPQDLELEGISAKEQLDHYYQNDFKSQYEQKNLAMPVSAASLSQPLSKVATNLQYIYVANKSPSTVGETSLKVARHRDSWYGRAHDTYHNVFKEYLEAAGFYDIFFIDDESGDVVYSVFKEADFATSLKEGPYAGTGLARVHQKAIELQKAGEVVFVDFSAYLPSYSYPASFVATPVFDGGRRLGTLVFQMPVERINELVNFHQQWREFGLEDSGSVYLVSSDGTLRSNIRPFVEDASAFLNTIQDIFPEDTVRDIGLKQTTIGLLKAPSDSAALALQQEQGVRLTSDAYGQEVISAYIPLRLPGIHWAVIGEIALNEGMAAIYELRDVMVFDAILVIVACAVMAGVVGVIISHRFVKPINALVQDISYVQKKGDFSHRIPVKGRDEVAFAGNAINQLLEDLQSALGEVEQVVQHMADGDFSLRIQRSLVGDLDQLKREVNRSVEQAEKSMSRIDQMMLALAKGNFDYTQEGRLNGSYQLIAENAQGAMSAIGAAINEILQTMKALSQGFFDQRVEQELPGDLGNLKVHLNNSLDNLSRAANEIERTSKAQSSGDLTVLVSSDYQGTLAKLKENSNSVSEKLIEVIDSVQKGADTVRVAADEISSGNLSLSQRTEAQAADLERTATSIDELTHVVSRNAERAQAASELSKEAQSAAEMGGDVARKATCAMSEITDSSRLMSDITTAINDIAVQTNLLALNASVEAARAGEQGKGFAVVASEVRTLAIRSSESASQIRNLIDANIKKINQGSTLVHDSGVKLTEIVEAVQKVNDIVIEISESSQEQSESIGYINETIRGMDSSTQQNAALVEEVAAASTSLSHQSNELQDQLSYFKLENTA